MSKICRKEGLELKKNLPGYLLMAPAVIAVLALSVYPLFRGIYLSFLNYNLVRPNDPTFNTFAGLQNYIDIFKDKVFLQSIGNTVKWTVVNLVVQLVAAMLLALALLVILSQALRIHHDCRQEEHFLLRVPAIFLLVLSILCQ